jgi:hypothetical protein
MRRAARLTDRLDRIAGALEVRSRASLFEVVVAARVGTEEAEGLPLGLHRTGSPGSTAGLLVYDPARGRPEVPEGALAPWGLVIVCHPDVIEPPPDLPAPVA